MSYPPGPPAPYSHQPHSVRGRDPAAAAKRAGILLFVLGGLIALLGIVNLTQGLSLSPEQFKEQFEEQQRIMPPGSMPAPPIPLETFRIVSVVLAALITAVGLSMMVLGGPVRRAARWAIITALVVAGVVGVALGFAVLAFGVMGLAAPPLLGLACCAVVPLGLCVLLAVWLFQGLRPGVLPQPAGYPVAPGSWSPPSQFSQPAPGQSAPGQPQSVSPPSPQSHYAGYPPLHPPPPHQVPQPPPGEPPVQFGYATRPLTKQPSAAPPPEQPRPSQESPPDGTQS